MTVTTKMLPPGTVESWFVDASLDGRKNLRPTEDEAAEGIVGKDYIGVSPYGVRRYSDLPQPSGDFDGAVVWMLHCADGSKKVRIDVKVAERRFTAPGECDTDAPYIEEERYLFSANGEPIDAYRVRLVSFGGKYSEQPHRQL